MSHQRRSFGLAVIAGFFLLPNACWAWGDEGHVIVAKIAELNLTKEARAGIRDLLGVTPISDKKIATFADFVRHNPHYPQFSKTAPWHFIDIPLDAEKYDPDADYCKDGQCVVAQVERLKAVLADKTKPDKDRRQAVIFLVHLVGDLHQPLHCATRGTCTASGT
jgi:hypothetical protein